ncbi:hypothetical protein DLAC_02324 [Tieghemostelium lacteum]|uniref:Uncharacterized protein n=1 Tax=Tieghemostelium lacteum TaxID=361077 RepID=A0A152A4P2_TIELA|nr:hypothetical protein DLAC_02324 [Tieghemostelium lacteum]|eukprot:KYR01206.1 hypothetical protein DLAC_02324 [Tieghemostelium lacteum]
MAHLRWPHIFKLNEHFNTTHLIVDSKRFNEFIDTEFQDWLDSDNEDNAEAKADLLQRNFPDEYMYFIKYLKWIDDFDPNSDGNDNNIANKRIEILLHTDISPNVWFRNSFLPKLLQSKDPKIRNAIIKNVQASYFAPNCFKEEWLPFNLLCKFIIECDRSVNISKFNLYFYDYVTFKYFKKISVYTKDKSLVNEKRDLTVENIRNIIQVLIRNDRAISSEKYDDYETLDDITLYLCKYTFQSLTLDDIQSLQSDYIQLIPLICRFTIFELPDNNNSHNPNGHIQVSHSTTFTQIKDYISELYKYYGKELIERKLSILLPKVIESPKNQVKVLIGLVYLLEDSQSVIDSLDQIYHIIMQDELIDTNVGHLLISLLNRYGTNNIKQLEEFSDVFFKDTEILPYLPASMRWVLFISVMSIIPQHTMYRMENILKLFEKLPRNYLVYFNRLLLKPSIRKVFNVSPRCKEYHQAILKIANNSSQHYIHLLEYIMSVEPKSEYNNLIENFTSAINDKDKWLIRDDHFYETLLKLYTEIKCNHTKKASSLLDRTLKSFVKIYRQPRSHKNRTKVSLDTILPFIKSREELDTLFILMDIKLKYKDKIKIFKYFLEYSQYGEEYIIDYLDSMIEDVNAHGTLDLLEGMKSFVNLDRQIHNYVLHYFISPHHHDSFDLKILVNLMYSLNNISETYKQMIVEFLKSLDTTSNVSKQDRLYRFWCMHKWLIVKDIRGLEIKHLYCHETIVSTILSQYKLSQHRVFSTKHLISLIKKNIPLSPQLVNLFLTQFKEIKEESKKENILSLIRNFPPLHFLLDSNQTGYQSTYTPPPTEQEINESIPYVPNLIIHNIVSFICGDPSVKPKEIIELALISKIFFQGVAKTFNSVKISYCGKTVSSDYLSKYSFSVSQWSLFSHGCYHMNYEALNRFHYRDVEYIFYQLGSLKVQSKMMYQVNREMKNLTSLSIFIGDALSIGSITNLISYCHCIETFHLQIDPELALDIMDIEGVQQYINILLKNNSSLKLVNFSYPFVGCKKITDAMEIVFQNLKEFRKSHFNDFNFINTLSITSKTEIPSNVEPLKSLLINSSEVLFSGGLNRLKALLNPEFFTNLKRVMIQLKYLDDDFEKFILSDKMVLDFVVINTDTLEPTIISNISKKFGLTTLKIIYSHSNYATKDVFEKLLGDCSLNPTLKYVVLQRKIKDKITPIYDFEKCNFYNYKTANNQLFIRD